MECLNFKTYYYDKIVLENHSIYETLGVITLFLRTGKKTQIQFIYQTMRHFRITLLSPFGELKNGLFFIFPLTDK